MIGFLRLVLTAGTLLVLLASGVIYVAQRLHEAAVKATGGAHMNRPDKPLPPPAPPTGT